MDDRIFELLIPFIPTLNTYHAIIAGALSQFKYPSHFTVPQEKYSVYLQVNCSDISLSKNSNLYYKILLIGIAIKKHLTKPTCGYWGLQFCSISHM